MQDSIYTRYDSTDVTVFSLVRDVKLNMITEIQELQAIVTNRNIQFEMLIDGEQVFLDYGVVGLEPHAHIIIDREQQIRFRNNIKFYYYDMSEIISEIEQILNE